MLSEAGYSGRRDPRALTVADPRNDVEFFYLRPRDIATYVGSGALDVGITGRDLLLDSGSPAVEIASLDFGESTFRFAAAQGRFSELAQLQACASPQATPASSAAFSRPTGWTATLSRSTARSNRRSSSASRMPWPTWSPLGRRCAPRASRSSVPSSSNRRPPPPSANRELPGIATLQRRLQGVLVARQFVLVDYDVPLTLLDAATAITPGIESPTVSPLHDPEWVAVRAMVPRADTNHVMDELYVLGARAILVTSIHAARI